MPGLTQNNSALNKAALRWLKEAKAPAPDHYLHLLNLAHWGLAAEVAAGWANRAVLKDQVDNLFGWKAANALAWLLASPDDLPREEVGADLLNRLNTAPDPQRAAHHVLEKIYDRQTSENPAALRKSS